MHPNRIAGEPGPPSYALHRQVAAIGVFVFRKIDIPPFLVKPILRRRTRLEGIAHDSGLQHLLVLQRSAEQPYATPALDRFRRRLLTVTVAGISQSSCKRMSAIRIERTEPRFVRRTLPVGIIACHLPRHQTVVRAEIIIQHAQQRRSIDEIAVMEMVVIEGIRVIRRIHADECTPFRVTRKIEPLFARREGVPVDQHFFQTIFRHTESSGIAHLQRKSHVMRHLRKAFSAPIGISTERTTLGIIRIERCHTGCRELLSPLHRSREERQERMHRISERKIVSRI